MAKIIACCGYRCDLCPAYHKNVKGAAHQLRISEGWRDIYGDDVQAVDVYCNGCLDMRASAIRMDTDCSVRACVLKKGISNCSLCSDYPCKEAALKPRNRAGVERHAGRGLSEEEYRAFVLPYEADRHLQLGRGAGKRGATE